MLYDSVRFRPPHPRPSKRQANAEPTNHHPSHSLTHSVLPVPTTTTAPLVPPLGRPAGTIISPHVGVPIATLGTIDRRVVARRRGPAGLLLLRRRQAGVVLLLRLLGLQAVHLGAELLVRRREGLVERLRLLDLGLELLEAVFPALPVCSLGGPVLGAASLGVWLLV